MEHASYTPLAIVAGYLVLLVGLGVLSSRVARGTSADYFVVSRTVGPFLLLMSVFGTTMTGFALVGSTGKAFTSGIGVYGLMASWSGLVHSAVFFWVGMRLWAAGKRYGYVTQCAYFQDRFGSRGLGYLLFPVLVLLVVPYLLVGVIAAGKFIQSATAGMFPEVFELPDLPVEGGGTRPNPMGGGVPPRWGGLVVCLIVLSYVFFGGLRGAVWANAFQTLVFMATGVVAFWMIADGLGGAAAASRMVAESAAASKLARAGHVGQLEFLSYCLVPLSVGMFPHVFQHWLTAKSARSFKLTVVAHPVFILVVWLPCILVGLWATARLPGSANPNAVLGMMAKTQVDSDILLGLVAAGVLAAIMSSLDSQFMCLGTMFTTDVLDPLLGRDRLSDRQKIFAARGFVLLVVGVTYALSLWLGNSTQVFDLGVWCFSGFAGLFPLAVASIYWKGATRAGAFACVVTTAVTWGALFYRDILAAKPAGASDETLIFGVMPVALILLASSTALVGVSLVTRRPSPATLGKFFA